MKIPFLSTRAPGITIDRVSESGIVQTAKFLSQYWDNDSPITNILQFQPSAVQHQYNEALVRNRVANGICHNAVDGNGQIVGTVIANILHKNDNRTNDPTEVELDRVSSLLPKVQLHTALLKKLYAEANIFSKYNIDSYLDLGRAYIRPDFRRLKLATEMNYSVISEARRTLGIELIVVAAANFYTQKAYRNEKKFAFELVHVIDYNSYKVGDEYPFKNDTVHQSMQLYASLVPLQSRQAVSERSHT